NRRDLPRDILLDSIVVLRYEKRSKSENKGKVPTEMELVLEQTQQEHQRDTQVITVKMEILLEPTSNKLMVDPHGFKAVSKIHNHIVRIKRLLDDLGVTAAKICITTAKQKMRMRIYNDNPKIINYSLWEVIENGNAPPITKVFEGVENTIAPTTTEKKAQRRYLEEGLEGMGLDQNFERLQKLICPVGDSMVKVSHNEDVNQKFLEVYLEEMDLTEADAMLTIRARRILKEQLKGVFLLIGTEHRALRKNTRRVVPVEITTSNALVSVDGLWVMIGVIKLIEGLESVEARLLVYKKNESVYEEDIKVLKREIHLREVAITELRRKLELAQKQKDKIQLTVENFENSSKSLSKLIDCQIVDKCKTGLGYNAVPPPYTGNFMPPKPDLSFTGLEEFTSEPVVIKLF
ncbi:hypothetical protein Tco_1030162, partial [Tanacetum coccineum]